MLRGVWQALNCLSIHATYCVIVAGASPGETKMWAAVRENGDFFTFVDHVKTNKHMFEFFSPSGSRTILVYRSYTDTKHRAASLRQQSFLFLNDMAIFRRGPPNGGIEYRCGRQKSQFLTIIWLRRVLSTVQDKEDHDKMVTTEQNLIVHNGKSEAAITNNKRLRSRYCRPTVEAN